MFYGPQPNSRRRPAFSLPEVLLVIAILGVLALLAMAAVQNVGGYAREVERAHWHEARALGGTEPRESPIRILFIGNSYTSTNDLPGMLVALAKASGAKPELVVDRQLAGGATLQKHWDDGTALEKIKSGPWDFVVLQEQSQTPLREFGRDERFYPYARKFTQEIRAAGAIPLFYMTWARPDTPGPQSNWTDSYVDITKELNAECVPAGMAVEDVKKALPDRTMFTDPGGHPTPVTTYLIACVFHAAIFVEPLDGVPNTVTTASGTVTVPAADAAVMHKAAWDAVKAIRERVKPGWRR